MRPLGRARWHRSDIKVAGDPAAEQALRFAAYHLNSAANPADERVSLQPGPDRRPIITAMYSGIRKFISCPFYILTWPKRPGRCLMYRLPHHGWSPGEGGRMGWQGAMYAWEFADTGEEAVSFSACAGPEAAICRYCAAGRSSISGRRCLRGLAILAGGQRRTVFLLEAGAEILLETARFWSSRAQPEADGTATSVTLSDRTNIMRISTTTPSPIMARWNIRRALEAAALLRTRWPQRWASFSDHLVLNDDELNQWHGVARITTGFDPGPRLSSNSQGSSARGHRSGELYRSFGPIDVCWGGSARKGQKSSSRPSRCAYWLVAGGIPRGQRGDKLPLFTSLGVATAFAQWRHAWTGWARLGYSELALRYFEQAVAIDLSDTHTTIAGGLHAPPSAAPDDSGLWLRRLIIAKRRDCPQSATAGEMAKPVL